MTFLKVDGLTKAYAGEPLWHVSFTAGPGDVVAVQGPSGSGKTSLLNVLGLLSRPTAGSYVLDGECVDSASARRRQELRLGTVTSVFQQGNLFAHLTVLENVLVGGASPRRAQQELARVGMGHAADRLAGLLSGGEQQRTAIARALARESSLVLADEPVAALDHENARTVWESLHECAARGAVVVVASHDPHVTSGATRVLSLGADVRHE